MDLLMSIRPYYIEEIKNGVKKYEFRKRIFKNKVDKIFMYSSTPVQKIVGYFIPGVIASDRPENIWKKCKELSGLSEREFFKYFEGKDKAFAIEIASVVFFKTQLDPLINFPNFVAPQSFYYTNNIDLRRIS